MVRLVRTPEKLVAMLKSMEQVDIQIMDHHKKQYLHSQRPVFHKLKVRPVKMVLQRRNNVIEDEDFEEITLDYSIPNQINPKAFPKKGKAFTVWTYPLPGNDEYYPANQYGSGYY
jgi:hypothetical protein